MMSLFRSKSKKLVITDPDPSHKVKYLGNVATTMMKGEGCVDKPVNILWTNYMKRPTPPIDMKLIINASGLKVYTKEQGLTEYSAHRISYCCADENYNKVFVWVYRHEGKKMKVELRCHAVLCNSDAKAKQIQRQLNEKLHTALNDFLREKTRNQNSRLTVQRNSSLKASHELLGGSLGSVAGLPLRKKLLSPGQNYRPPVERSASAPKLLSIIEDGEDDVVEDFDLGDPDFHDVQLEPPLEEDDEEDVDCDKGSLLNECSCNQHEEHEQQHDGVIKQSSAFYIYNNEVVDDNLNSKDAAGECSDEDGESAESGFSEEPRTENNT